MRFLMFIVAYYEEKSNGFFIFLGKTQPLPIGGRGTPFPCLLDGGAPLLATGGGAKFLQQGKLCAKSKKTTETVAFLLLMRMYC